MLILRETIMESLISILETKRLDKITVKEIADTCNISRQTFYYYFKDIYDVARQIFAQTSKRAKEYFNEGDDWSTCYMRMMKWCRLNKNFVLNTFNSNFGHILIDNMKQAIFSDLLELLKTNSKDLKITEDQYLFISKFYSSALISVTIDWIENDMQEEPNKIINNLYLLVGEDFHKMLIRFHNSNK